MSFVDVFNLVIGVGLGLLCVLFPPALVIVVPYFLIRWRMTA